MTQQSSSPPAANEQDKQPVQAPKLPANVRVMIGLVASPTLLVIAFSIYSVLYGNWQEPGISGIIFSSLGVFAYYVVIVGRLPQWFNFKQKTK
jgi:heme/copper-type cytochrome/quinol oxidase subunit 2